jgi:multiple sugar transport system permease protein
MSRKTEGIIIILVVLFIAPVIQMVLMSFKQPLDLFSTFLFFKPTGANYVDLFSRLNLTYFFKNSIIIASGTAVLSVILGAVAAYSFARYNFPMRKFLLFMVLFSRMLPPVAGVVPLFLVMRRLGFTDTYGGIILLYTAFQTPIVIWMIRGFFLSIPRELEEAAVIDGCSRLTAFLRITLPLSRPGLAATSIFAFTLSWNEFLFALIFTGTNTKTIPVAVPELIGEMGIFWGQICAAGTLAVLPIFIFSFLAQKQLISGLTFGAVKG